MSVVIKGDKTLYDANGMAFECKVQSVRGTDKGFTKVWIMNFMHSIGLIANKKVKVAFWLIEHANKDNIIIYSQKQIWQHMQMELSKENETIGLSTIKETMNELKKADFIRKKGKVYMLNPDVLVKTYSHSARMAILTEYITSDSPEPSAQDSIVAINQRIAEMEQRKLELIAQVEHENKVKWDDGDNESTN